MTATSPGIWAAVAVPRPFETALTYSVPAWLQGELAVGHVVRVPLGSITETGYVVGFPAAPEVSPDKVKPISRLVDAAPAFDEDQLGFFEWIADYYLAPIGLVIHTALPSRFTGRVVRGLEPTEAGVEALAAGEPDDALGLALREVIRRPGLTRRGLEGHLGHDLDEPAAKRAIDGVVRRGWAAWVEREVAGVQGKVRTVELVASVDDALARVGERASRQRAVLRALEGRGRVDLAQLLAEQGASARGAVTRLVELGVVAEAERDDLDVLDDVPAAGPARPPTLNEHQRAALEALTGPEASRPWLLWGVTGSGKTEVFLGAARHALERGRQVCVLVPEIGLTPQLVGRFKARFGDGVAVLHSGLTAKDRLAHWRRIRSGEAQVAVGARSALFAPFRDLGLIVVDEEHDDSYKQDEGVHYNARDLAVVLGHRARCPVVLASATPSMETWHNARTGRYGLLRLPERATSRAVPRVELVDLADLPKDEHGRRPLFAPEVVAAMRETVDADGKVIVLYNRRGFATMVQCGACGGTYECPNCGISMTLHRRDRVLACHYCALKRAYTGACPACGAPELDELGKGTERVEDEVARLLPGVPIGRMDADTTAGRGAHHRILDEFARGRTRVLVGTQIVAKGHDFPDVHLAVVANADQGFKMPDFRASERTYALLVQLAGRAGRGLVAGRVLVQTWDTDHYALRELDDVEAFLEREARLRFTMRYPPFYRLVLVRLDGPERPKVAGAAAALARALRAAGRNHPDVQVLGPAQAALPRLVGRWRFQVIVRSADLRSFRRYLAEVRPLLGGAGERGVRVQVDVDPRHLM